MKPPVLAGLFLALFSFIAAAGISISKIAAHREVNQARSHVFDVFRALDALSESVTRAESAWNNYARIGDPRYLTEYDSAVREVNKRTEDLKKVYSGPRYDPRLETLLLLINSRIAVLDELVAFSRKGIRASPAQELEVMRREELIHESLSDTIRALRESEDNEVIAFDVKIEALTVQSISSLMAGSILSVITFSGLFYLLHRELRERKKLEQIIKKQALHDPLTGLPNRLSLTERLDNEIRHANRSGERLALMFVDLDHFKQINDSLGHEAGDRLLIAVAGRLQAGIRESDTVARIGGDEFNIILTNISSAQSVSMIAEKVIGSFERPFPISGRLVRSTASAGISIYPEDGEDPGALLRNADAALYQAKQQGRNNFKFYTPALDNPNGGRPAA